MTGDLSKFAPSLSQRYGVDLNVAQGGLPSVNAPLTDDQVIDKIGLENMPEFLRNLIERRRELEKQNKSNQQRILGGGPLVPIQGSQQPQAQKSTEKRQEVKKLEDFKPERDQTPATSVQGDALDINRRNQELVAQIIQQNPELLNTILQSRKAEARVVGEEARKRDVIGEWGAITRAEIARDQALAQSLLATNVLAHTPNMGVIQALNATAPSVVGAYKMGSSVLK
jgi:hypothetical protein|tara:strand:+ start:29895 stop:30575 length:681 start_codon:yes stop_codon:yes gene_type:complete